MATIRKTAALVLVGLFAVACGETPTEAPEVPLKPSLAESPEDRGADVVKDWVCGVRLYPVVRPADNPPSMYEWTTESHWTLTPSGNWLFRCKAQLPAWAQPPDQTVVWRGGNCGSGTSYYYKVFTPSGEINLTCGFNSNNN